MGEQICNYCRNKSIDLICLGTREIVPMYITHAITSTNKFGIKSNKKTSLNKRLFVWNPYNLSTNKKQIIIFNMPKNKLKTSTLKSERNVFACFYLCQAGEKFQVFQAI